MYPGIMMSFQGEYHLYCAVETRWRESKAKSCQIQGKEQQSQVAFGKKVGKNNTKLNLQLLEGKDSPEHLKNVPAGELRIHFSLPPRVLTALLCAASEVHSKQGTKQLQMDIWHRSLHAAETSMPAQLCVIVARHDQQTNACKPDATGTRKRRDH